MKQDYCSRLFYPSQRFYLFLLFIASVSCSRIKTQIDGEEERQLILKNQIKTITEYRTTFLLGMQQPEQTSSVKVYDGNGLPVKEVYYKTDGKVDAIVANEYDKNGNMVESKGIAADGSFIYRETKNYDEHNNRKELYHFLADGSYKYRNLALYDKFNRMTELLWYWPDGFKSKNKYVYNGRKKIEDSEYDAKGNLTYTWIYRYDVHGNLIEAVQFSAARSINKRTSYEYNDKNQLIKQVNSQGELEMTTMALEYNDKGLLAVKTESTGKGRISNKYRVEYSLK